MPKRKPTVYISSTFEDLKLHRRAARDQLTKLGFDVVSMEAYVADEVRPLELCLEDVRNAELYIGLFAWRYGDIAPDHEQSFSELEYREAGLQGVERLIFLLQANEPWPPNQMDSHVSGDGSAILRLRRELEQAHLCAYFTTPETLVNTISASVQRVLERRSAAAGAVVVSGQTAADLAIQDHVRSALAKLSPSLEPYYVSLEATAEFLEMGPSDLMLPSSFAVAYRHLHGLPQRSERLEAAELASDRFCQFVVLGEPGAGKTTFLRSLEVQGLQTSAFRSGCPGATLHSADAVARGDI